MSLRTMHLAHATREINRVAAHAEQYAPACTEATAALERARAARKAAGESTTNWDLLGHAARAQDEVRNAHSAVHIAAMAARKEKAAAATTAKPKTTYAVVPSVGSAAPGTDPYNAGKLAYDPKAAARETAEYEAAWRARAKYEADHPEAAAPKKKKYAAPLNGDSAKGAPSILARDAGEAARALKSRKRYVYQVLGDGANEGAGEDVGTFGSLRRALERAAGWGAKEWTLERVHVADMAAYDRDEVGMVDWQPIAVMEAGD